MTETVTFRPGIQRLAAEVAELARLAIVAGHTVWVVGGGYTAVAGPDGDPLKVGHTHGIPPVDGDESTPPRPMGRAESAVQVGPPIGLQQQRLRTPGSERRAQRP